MYFSFIVLQTVLILAFIYEVIDTVPVGSSVMTYNVF